METTGEQDVVLSQVDVEIRNRSDIEAELFDRKSLGSASLDKEDKKSSKYRLNTQSNSIDATMPMMISQVAFAPPRSPILNERLKQNQRTTLRNQMLKSNPNIQGSPDSRKNNETSTNAEMLELLNITTDNNNIIENN